MSIVRREDGQTEDRNASGPLTEREDYCNGMADGAGLVGWLEFVLLVESGALSNRSFPKGRESYTPSDNTKGVLGIHGDSRYQICM